MRKKIYYYRISLLLHCFFIFYAQFYCFLCALTSGMREKVIEKKLAEEVKRRGGLCEKWNSGTSGWPDRIVLLPDGKFGFVEVKAPGEEPRPLQLHRHKQLRQLGYKVYVLDDKDRIGEILDDIQTT